jgi:NadR type nicotinamide-nucleotide adenylyltransferase
MRELCPGAEVLHLDEELPQYPHEHPRFWELWTAALRRLVPTGPDLVFSSEDYGDELARRLGARHVCVDRERRARPVSGTQVRERPLALWEHLPPPVRAWYARRVVVFGPESTGKTTLAARLARHFQTPWVPEHARDHLDRKAARVELADIPLIARGQIAAEERLAREANRVLICDTDVLTTVIWSELYFGECPEWVRAEAARRRYDLYLLLDIDVPWVPDPQRDQPHTREWFRERCRAALRARGARFVEIGGGWEQRFARAVAAVEGLISVDIPGQGPETRQS